MSTLKQKKLAMKVVEALQSDNPPNQQDLLISAGYSPLTASNSSSRQLEQKGVIEELERLGFCVEAADNVIFDLLKRGRKEETRIKASQEIYKRMGAYAPEKKASVNVNVEMGQTGNIEKVELIRQEYEAKLRESLLQNEI